MIDEVTIKKLCRKYNLKYQIFDNTKTVIINSITDRWLVEVYDNYLLLKHLNTKCNKKGKIHYHVQRKFYDWDFLIKSINTHKRDKIYNHMFRMKKLLMQLK